MKYAQHGAMALLGCGVPLLPAQDVAWDSWGNPNLKLLGKNIVVGDINHDGYEDVAVICDGRCNATFGAQGNVRILSGADGATLLDVPATLFANGPHFWDLSPAGDWNQDGTPDFASLHVAWPYSHVLVHDGRNGATLLAVPEYGLEVAADGDFDGDGRPDIIVAANSYNTPTAYVGMVRVRSHTGALRYQLVGTPNFVIGNYVATVGDVDDDGCDDFVMTCIESTGRGAAVVVSGRDGSYLRTCYGELPGDNMCCFVDVAGDFDGDGYQDFVVAGCGGARSGAVVYSARTGQRLRAWYSTSSGSFAKFVAGRGIDYDGDGFPDILAGDPMGAAPVSMGAIDVLSGRDGTTIHRLTSGYNPFIQQVGSWVNGLRPGPGSHVGTILAPGAQSVLTPGVCPTGPIDSLVRAYKGLPRTSQLLSPPCAGNLASAPDLGLQSVAPGTFRVHVSDAPPNVPAVLLLGATSQSTWVPTPIPLDGIGLPGCTLRSPVDLLAVVTTGAAGPNAGYARLDLPLSVPLQGFGTWWVAAQWWVLGTTATFPGGMSQTVRWRH